jgi:hypothetical protein
LRLAKSETVGTGRKRGMYETEYGNVCYVSGPNAKSAYDIDADQRIPIALVTFKYIGPAH